MVSAALGLRLVLAIIGVGMAMLSLLLLRAIDRRGESAMASLRFYQEKTVGDFLLLLLGTAPLCAGMLLYAVGGFLERPLLMNVGRGTGIIASSSMVIVLFRWWRRF